MIGAIRFAAKRFMRVAKSMFCEIVFFCRVGSMRRSNSLRLDRTAGPTSVRF